MLFTVGGRTQRSDVMAILLGCHHRMREHLALARRLANAPHDSVPESIRAAAARVRQYFGVAFPLHREDEEIDIFPCLLGFDAELDAAIRELTRDHDAHEQFIAKIVSMCAALEQDPSQLRTSALELAEVVRVLEIELGAHITLEERTVFPAIGRLSAADREHLHQRMRARR